MRAYARSDLFERRRVLMEDGTRYGGGDAVADMQDELTNT